jgi:predicted dehydrogenase
MRPRVGFLGVGWIGRHRMEAILATGAVEAVAIADPSPEMAAGAARLAPEARLAGGLDELLALGLDAVVIATPRALHAAQSIAALERGAAVFCQKPLGRTAAEAAAVVQAARAANRLLALWAQGFPAVADARGTLLAGGEPLGRCPGRVEDYAQATLELETGAVVRLACSWRLHAGCDAVIGAAFYGTAGGAALRNVGGSFYDLMAERLTGTATTILAEPPDAWGGRAAADWAMRLAAGERFDPEAERLVDVARVLDRIYGR